MLLYLSLPIHLFDTNPNDYTISSKWLVSVLKIALIIPISYGDHNMNTRQCPIAFRDVNANHVILIFSNI